MPTLGLTTAALLFPAVLAALQFWVVALAIPLLVVRGQIREYEAWRAEHRRVDKQRRREQGEVRGMGGRDAGEGMTSADRLLCTMRNSY